MPSSPMACAYMNRPFRGQRANETFAAYGGTTDYEEHATLLGHAVHGGGNHDLGGGQFQQRRRTSTGHFHRI